MEAYFPRPTRLTLPDGTTLLFEAGVHSLPDDYTDHWWLKANGVLPRHNPKSQSKVPLMPELSYLASLAEEIEKFTHETELEAKELVDKDMASLRDQKNQVMTQARAAIDTRKRTIQGLAAQLDKVSASISNTVKPKV